MEASAVKDWIELIKANPYLTLVSVSAIVAMAVTAGLAKLISPTSVLLSWSVCFVILLLSGFLANNLLGRKQRDRLHGIQNVYINRGEYNERRPRLFESADNIVLHSIYADVNDELSTLIEGALKKRKSIEILIADPSNEHVQGHHDLQLALMSTDTPQRIRQDLDRLREIDRRRRAGDWVGKLYVSTYACQPMWCIYIFDEELFAAPYLYRSEGGETLCVHARRTAGGPTTYDQLKRHYQQLWSKATPFELFNANG